MQVSAVTFREQVTSGPVPLPIAESFGLMDFDSAGPLFLPFSVRISFTNALDGLEHEGLTFNTSGTNVTITSTSTAVGQRSQVLFVLEGGTTYQEYQQVSCE